MSRRHWLLLGLLFLAMLPSVWIGPYAPLYDYPNHLLEAQVVVQYHNPALAYAGSYQINEGWFWQSNALTTLFLIWLGYLLPITVAGQLVLSFYLLLFIVGLGLLLHQHGQVWPLLLLAPALAYNFAFTSGWLNFSYGLALGSFVLVIFLHWRETSRRWLLWLIAGLLLLVYTAHLVAWTLLLVILAGLVSTEPFKPARHGWLFLAMNSATPILLFTRPGLGLAALFIAPLIWEGKWLWDRLHLDRRLAIRGTIGIVLLFIGLNRLLEVHYKLLMPDLDYTDFDKLTFPFRLFSLPHQFLPPNPLLIGYNLLLLILLTLLGALLIWNTLKYQRAAPSGWLLTLGLLALLYFFVPSRTPNIWITEPRILLFALLVILVGVRLPPPQHPLYRVTTGLSILICILSLVGPTSYATYFNQQAITWRQQMGHLAPAQRVLLLRDKTSLYIGQPTLVGSFNRFYTGEYFSTVYNLENGGFASRTFNNGPVRPADDIPIPAYDWPGFSDRNYVRQHCSALRRAYDAVLFWGQPHPEMVSQLDECFVAGPRWPETSIWYVK